jgi:hypothetical protein
MQFLNSEKQEQIKSKLIETSDGAQRIYHTQKRRGRHFVSKRGLGLLRFWRSLTFAQRCYLIATGMGCLMMYFNIQNSAFDIVMFLFVLAGIINEIWPRFMTVWHSLPGKAVILFVYAIIANFALASASGMVNDIAGVSANALPYSHNFALLLTVPSWFLITSLMFLLVLTLITPIYLLVLLALKPIGVKRIWHPPEYRFVLTTAFIRWVWTFFLIFELSLLSAQAGMIWEDNDDFGVDIVSLQIAGNSIVKDESAANQSSQENVENTTITDDATNAQNENTPDATSASETPLQTAINEQIENAQTQTQAQRETLAKEIDEANTDIEDEFEEAWNEAQLRRVAFKRFQHRALADFIYVFEADSRSRCAHADNSRVIELNDYEVLEITRDSDEANEIGYKFVVIPCKSAAIGG